MTQANPNLAQIDFTGLDRDALLTQLINRISSVAPQWTDAGESDIGRALLELFTALNTSQLMRLDMSANELYLATVKQRGSAIKLSELIAYKVAGNVSSIATLRFTIASAHAVDIPIPKFTRSSTTGDPTLDFYNFSAATLLAGNTFVDTEVTQGSVVTETFAGTGLVDQTYSLSNKDVGQNAIEVTVSSSIWSEVANFLSSGNTDENYTFKFDANEEGVITFGDGAFGKVPPNGATISVTYLRSSGAAGNVGANTITKLQTVLTDVLAASVTASTDNAASAIGGSDPETIESVQKNAPASLASLNRAVTKADYIAIVEGVDGVARANAWGESEQAPPNVSLFNKVRISFSPNGGGTPSAQLRTNVTNTLEGGSGVDATAMVIIRHEILNPIYVSLPVTATVTLVQGFISSTVQTSINAELTDFFSLAELNFDEDIRISKVSQLIQDVQGVDYITLTLPQAGRVVGTEPDTYNITGANDTFTVAVDGGGNQNATLTTGTARTAAQVATDINGGTTGLTASVVGEGQVQVISDTTGAASQIEIVNGNANATLGFSDSTTYTGSTTTDVAMGKQEIAILGTVTLTMVVP
jgi:hypothetical protein